MILILYLLIFKSQGAGHRIWESELTIEIMFDKSGFNLSQSNEPVTFHGLVNFTSISVIPLTLHLEPFSDLGDVFLSQYEFTFRLPDSIPFDGLIPIPPELNLTAIPQLTIHGYVEQGVLQSDIPPMSCIIPVYYYEEEESINETKEPKEKGDALLLVSIPSCFVISIIFIILIYWRTMNNGRRSKR